MKSFIWALWVVVPLAGALSTGGAQAAQTQRVRGTIEKLDGSTLTVKTRDGDTVSVHLLANYKVAAVVKKSLSDIKKGDYVGTAAMPQANGTLKALEVTIFSPAQRGAGEGSRPYDIEPHSTMTNATVTSAVAGVDGRTLILTYKGGQKNVIVPTNAPVVTYTPASHADAKPGVAVSVNAQKSSDGSLQADHFSIGRNGVAPPT